MRKRILSLLLCIVLCLSFAPTAAFAYSAGEIPGTTGTGTASDPVICDTFAELKAALQYQGDLYIRVDSFTNTTGLNYYSLKLGTDYTNRDAAIRIPAQTTKHLEINTTVDIRTTYLGEEGDDVLYSTIANYGNLYISGSGSLCGGFNASLPNGVIYNTGGGSVTVSGNVTIDGSHSVTTAHGCAIYNHQGNLTISGGTFIGIGSSRSPDGRVSAVNVRENATANISGGHFKATNSSNAVGLIVNSNANVQLSGGTFEGIDAEDSGHNISDFLKSGCNYYKVTDDSLFDASAITTTSEALRVVEQTPITSVEVTPNVITIPKNSTYQFTATVNGTGSFSNEVTWSITGGDFGTNIDSTGLLSIAKANTENTIIVKATSVADPTKYGTATVTLTSATPENPTITSVEVAPNVITIPKNSTYQFTATVNGTGSFSNEVTWSITGGDFGTNIDSTGLLSIAKANTENTIIVKATSVADPTKYGTATVTLTSATPENPTITSVEVTPNVITIPMDSQQQFTATVRGTGSFSDEVTWSITGGNNGTNISSGGLLSVAQHNTASDTIIVKATSVADPTKYGTATVTLTSVNTYTVSFEMNGHGNQEASQTVKAGEKANKPVDPTAEGWTFDGWYADATFSVRFDFNTAITSNTIIYAKWTQNTTPPTTTYTIIAGANGEWTKGSTTGLAFTSDAPFDKFDSVKVDGSTIAATNYTAEAGSTKITLAPAYLETLSVGTHTIEIVSKDGSASTNFTVKSAEQPPVVPTNYTVTFNMNGHGDQITAQTVKEGEKATKPTDPTASGWTFNGWYADATFSAAFDFDAAINANTTVYAKWTENTVPQPPVPEKFTVSFNMNGHGTQIADQTVEDGSKATKPANPTASGYTFGGWYADATFSTKFDFNTAITANTTVYAKWTKNSAAPADPTTPQTGDSSNMFLWIALLFVSGGALVGTAVYGKKKKYRAE